MSVTDTRHYVDLAVIVPLEEELISVMDVFPSKENRSTATSLRHLVETGSENIECLIVQQSVMGRTAATQAAVEILTEYNVGMFACLGIAGSLSDDMDLTDICYTGTLSDVYDNSKAGDALDGGVSLNFSPVHYGTPIEITTAFNFMRTQPELRPRYTAWQAERSKVAELLLPDGVPGRHNRMLLVRTPTTMCGTIICGAVSNSKAYNDSLSKIDRKVAAIETESGGIFSITRPRGIPTITIRAISDYADQNKKKLERTTAGAVRAVAAGNAATFLRLQLSNPYFLDTIGRAKNQRKLELQQQTEERIGLPQTLAQLIASVGYEVDQNLRELCPEYRLQSSGYKLPVPRARRREASKTIEANNRPPAFEIRKIIENLNLIMLEVPRNYPDQALPWMIAYDLLTTEIDGRQAVPLVGVGERLSPPRNNLSKICGYDIEEISRKPGAVPVIIIDGCPFQSKTKMKFLLSEMERYPDARFIIFSRGNSGSILSTDLAVQFKVEVFDICGISFAELTHFVERNFRMNGLESEVIALRLTETFTRYELSAHPSYLAAISNTTLDALINANRRSELIQLAVDGILSFVVAADTSDISLSRTTRSRFLQKLVRAIKVDGRNFDQPSLIMFTKQFAEKFDFSISAVEFIASFADRGILHFRDGMVAMSLPYVESYLLARELLSDSPAARKYFSLTSASVDFATFDTYCELGPSRDVVDIVEAAITGSISTLPISENDEAAALDIQGTGTKGIAVAKYKKTYSQMQRAMNEIIEGKPASDRKQQLLDMRDDVRITAAQEAKNRALASPKEDNDTIIRLNHSIECLYVAIILMNSSAEHLTGEVKRELASKIVELSSRILSRWVQLYKTVDFVGVRNALTAEENISRFCAKHDIDRHGAAQAAVRNLMRNIVDIIEEGFLTCPLATLLGMVSQAHRRVLSKSLSQLHPTKLIERLIHSTWLLEAEPAAGKEPAIAVVRELPRVPMLRGTICNHVISTAYWNYSDKADRKHLIAVANAAIEPFAEKVDPKLLEMPPEQFD
jgi:nucleoside phosphorylase